MPRPYGRVQRFRYTYTAFSPHLCHAREEKEEDKEIDKEDELAATENEETPKDKMKNKLEESGNVKKVVKEKKEPERASEKKQEEEED